MDYKAILNEVQYKAVTTTEGAVLVFAGAGSGKTRVLTHRVEHLVRDCNVSPFNILAITFTNKATREMKERLKSMIGDCGVWVSTFHSLCTQILFRYADRLGYQKSFSIYDDSETKKVLSQVMREMHLEEDKKESYYKNHISTAKNAGLSPEKYFDCIRGDEKDPMLVVKVFERYEHIMKERNAMDFDDLLIKCVELFLKNSDVLAYYQDKFRYIHVDEFQDTNGVQFSLVKLLSAKWGNIFVVGDDDQSIYAWRGAVVKNILDFNKIFPDVQTFKLETNYRSTQQILDCANNLIKNNSVRAEKVLVTDNKGGVKVEYIQCVSEYNEVDKVVENIFNLKKYNGYENREFAVLVRNNALTRLIEIGFNKARLPYQVYGGFKFFDRKEIQDVLAYMRLIANSRDNGALTRIINFPRRGIGDTTVKQLVDNANRDGVSMFDYLKNIANDSSFNRGVKDKLAKFYNLINELCYDMANQKFLDFAVGLVKKIGFESFLKGTNKAEDINRWENIEEFLTHIKENYDSDEVTLEEFLHTVAINNDVDEEVDDNKITISTMHASKGLEFRAVFIVACEEGILPSKMSSQSAEELSEERRVMYVAITRAKERLFISYVDGYRVKYNQRERACASRFVAETRNEDNFVPQLEARSTFYNDKIEDDYSSAIPRNNQMHKVGYVPPKPIVAQKPKIHNADTKEFVSGAKVKHARYGEGMVIATNGEGMSKTVSVAFTNLGIKKFAVANAPLTLVK